MINQDFQLKVQAYLDGELSAAEAAKMAKRVAGDKEAQSLLEALRGINATLAGHEAECKLPESREFFWSKIEREIERQSHVARPVVAGSWLARLQRHFLPLSGLAIVMCLLGVVAIHSGKVAGQFGEMELASDDMGAYTFRDQQQQMTMVWLYDRTDTSQFTEASSLASVEPE